MTQPQNPEKNWRKEQTQSTEVRGEIKEQAVAEQFAKAVEGYRKVHENTSSFMEQEKQKLEEEYLQSGGDPSNEEARADFSKSRAEKKEADFSEGLGRYLSIAPLLFDKPPEYVEAERIVMIQAKPKTPKSP